MALSPELEALVQNQYRKFQQDFSKGCALKSMRELAQAVRKQTLLDCAQVFRDRGYPACAEDVEALVGE